MRQFLQLSREGGHIRIALVRLLCQRLEQYALHAAGEFRRILAWRRQRVIQLLQQHRHGRIRLERLAPGHQFVKDHAQRIDIGAVVDIFRQTLFRGHVFGRTDAHPLHSQARGLVARCIAIIVQRFGNAKIGQNRRTIGAQQDIGRFYIAVNYALGLGVRVVQCLR